MMKSLKTGVLTALKNWPTLICFEIIYKTLGLGLILDLLNDIRTELLQISGFSVIGQNELGTVLQNPTALLLILCGLIALTYYVYFEITALTLSCEAGWRGELITLWALCKKTFQCSVSVFHYRNLPVVLLLLPIIALSAFPLTNGLLNAVRIPEFILEHIRQTPSLLAVFICLIALLNIVLFLYLFSFPLVILDGGQFIGSLGRNRKLLRRRKRKTLGYLLICAVFIVLAVIACACVIPLFLWACGKLIGAPDGGLSFFKFYYPRWSAVSAVLSSMLGSLTLVSALVTLFHRYRGDQKPDRKPAPHVFSQIIRRTAAILASVLLLLLYSETEAGGAPWKPAGAQTAIIAHRAGAAFAPENTVAALRTAIAAGAEIAEIDVQQTRDQTLIVMHDANFKRTIGFDQNVWETDGRTIRTLDAGSLFSAKFTGEPIPTLQDMLSAAKGNIRLMIELKSTGHEGGLVEATIAQIRANGMERQCSIASMNLELLQQVKSFAPEIETVYISAVLLSDLYDLDYIDSYSVETSFATAGMIASIRANGKKLYVWTANQEVTMKKILRLEADGLVTDNPELAVYFRDRLQENLLQQFWIELLYH